MGITFYATMKNDHLRPYMADVPILLPASSWSRIKMRKPNLPSTMSNVAADSGGFVATFKWGDYKYTPDEYVRWLNTFKPRWAATMDYCCEREITGKNEGVVRQRQQRTTDMAHLFWAKYLNVDWAWVPTVQGWYVEDYVQHARDLKPLIEEMQSDGHPDFRVGIGTLCRRASAEMVRRVVQAVAHELPDVPLHLWGVKLAVLQSRYELPQVVSVDSAAWDVAGFGQDGKAAYQERKALGLSQKEHAHRYLLPRYLGKIEAATNQPKIAVPRQTSMLIS